MTIILRRSLSRPVSSSNFWIVVKIMPPCSKSFSFFFRSARPPSCDLTSFPFSFKSWPTCWASCRKNLLHPENCSYSCWSRSFLSVTTRSVTPGASRISLCARNTIENDLPEPCVCQNTPPLPSFLSSADLMLLKALLTAKY